MYPNQSQVPRTVNISLDHFIALKLGCTISGVSWEKTNLNREFSSRAAPAFCLLYRKDILLFMFAARLFAVCSLTQLGETSCKRGISIPEFG